MLNSKGQHQVLLRLIELLDVGALHSESLERAIQTSPQLLRAFLLVGMHKRRAFPPGMIPAALSTMFSGESAICRQSEVTNTRQ